MQLYSEVTIEDHFLRHPLISHSLFAWILLNKSKINQSVDYALWVTKNTQFVGEKMNKEV